MKKLAISLMMILPCLTYGQMQLQGKVVDNAGKPLDAATIILMQDEKQIALAFADSGNFNLTFPAGGTYTIFASLVGYQQVRMPVQLPKDSLVLTMQQDNKQLDEVTVTFRKPLIERKVDRVTFNVENSILASGSSAWESLGKAPGIQVNSNEEITVNRKGVRIYINGKPLNLSGDDLSAYLKGLPSHLLAQIEVYSNPPAQFDAAGASVINIITKKGGKQGLNVTLNTAATQGIYLGHTTSTTFNYRNNKLNLYGSYAFAHRHNFQDHNVDIDYGTSFWSSPNRIIYKSDNHNYRLGADYLLTSNQVIGFLVTGSNRAGSSAGYTKTRITGNQMALDSTLKTDNLASTRGNQYAYNLNYNMKLDSSRQSLNIDIDYSPYQSRTNSFADNISFLPNGQQSSNKFHIFTPSSQHIAIYSGKADYMYRLFGHWEAASGIKFSSTKSRNHFDYYNRGEKTQTAVPANFNHFLYHEKIAAAYTSLSRIFGQWTLQGGLRAEFTRIKGHSITLDSLNERRYFKVFPTVFVLYKANENHQLQFNYAYRIERPEYNRLNPAKRYSSPFNFYVGNPALQPAFVHNAELSYTYKQQYSITAYYTSIQDVFTNINVQDNQTKLYYGTHANLGLSANAGVRLSAAFQPGSWWDINVMGGAYRLREKSAYLSSAFDYHLFSYDANLTQSFTIHTKAAIKAEVSGTYNGPGIQGIYRAGHNWQVNAGVKTNILRGAGTLRLAVNDIFNTYNVKIRISYLDQKSNFFHHAESRNVSLNFSYRIGKNVTASRSRSTASEEERKRAQ
jgi:outer membrane receptor protein involved in Fe transport